ncbi:unnamed protein product [Oppiella nova]|uniref:Solute carrier organic anion transporter family member n=1 Tax=Oppiella nova TaxID=334625 RepID=A0A7R9M471_9ACAR|nr:unnamed protein product [Oppiella nova]CAG2170465.1 unnamed protein product [Oppiella nova]
MKSTESGLIAGGYDVGAFLFLAPISYFGGTRSKPLFISSGIIVMGVGALVFSLPYFTSGRYEFSEEVESICLKTLNTFNETSNTFCSKQNSHKNLSNYKWIFFFGQFLHGVGATPLYTLGCTYLDESLPTKLSSLYLGIFYSMAIVGPAVGYVFGGQMLKWLYVDWISVDSKELGLSNTSPVWVGAWYLVFIIGFMLSLVIFFPISLFPKELPDTKNIRKQKVSEAHSIHNNTDAVDNKDFGQSVKDFPKSLMILLRNPTFMFLNLTGASEGMVLSALASFLPKIIEQQFSLATSTAALMVGIVSIPGAGGGTFLGGYIVNRYDLKCAAIIKFCIFCSVVSICLSSAFLISCPNVNFAGLTDAYPNQSSTVLDIDSKCNSDCFCSSYQYDPVCGLNNQMYYSACYAGCRHVSLSENSKHYSDCKCLKPLMNSSQMNPISSGFTIEAKRNKCESECKLLPYFLFMIFLCEFFAFLIAMPSLTATLRCVADSQKSFALGIQWIGVRILGTIPAPLIFGSLIDLSCILWQKTCDKSSGACLVYDNQLMATNILGIVFFLKVLSFIFLFFSWFLYKSPQTETNAGPQNGLQSLHNEGMEMSAQPINFCPKLNLNDNSTKL